MKSEETKVRQEDLSKLLYEVQLLRTQQDNLECQMQDMKQWVERFGVCAVMTPQALSLSTSPAVDVRLSLVQRWFHVMCNTFDERKQVLFHYMIDNISYVHQG